IESGEIRLHPEAGQTVERLQLRRERKRPVGEARPHERLLTEPVPREQQATVWRIPQRDREHAVEPLDERGTVLLVEMRDHRRVAAAADLVAAGGGLGTELREAVELAVEHR